MRNGLRLLRQTRRVASIAQLVVGISAATIPVVAIESRHANAQQRYRQNNETRAGQPQSPPEPTSTTIAQVNQPAREPNQPAATTQAEQPEPLRRVFFERSVDPVAWFTGFLLFVAFLQWRVMR